MSKSVFLRAAAVAAFAAIALPATAQMFDSYRTPSVSQPGRAEWNWDGGSRLAVGVPGTVRYSEQGSPRVIVTGPNELVRRVRFRDGTLNTDWGFSWNSNERLEILVTGVKLNSFGVSGSSRMMLGKLERDSLEMRVSGSGKIIMDGAKARDVDMKVSGSGDIELGTLDARSVDVEISGSGTAMATSGRADRIELSISGSGKAEFSSLSSSQAQITISGSGRAAVAPRDAANIRIAGSGRVRMPTSPPNLQSNVTGSGRITTAQADIR